ncbi:MAG: hypothetical protein RR115_07800 [Hydrogenoanaerobacterium sp.]
MTESEAIESTYFDTAIVLRCSNAKDAETKRTSQTELQIYSDIPCALSRNKNTGIAFDKGYGKTSGSYTLFCSPSFNILTGDKLKVKTSAGQSFTLWAGKAFVYASHAEIPLSEEARA